SEQSEPEQSVSTPPTNNNNQICDKAISEFSHLKEAYTAIYKQNQNLAVKKFGELTGAYTRLKQENDTLHKEIKKQLEDINKKLNIDTLATNLADKLKLLISGGINYEIVKEKYKEVLEKTQDFLESIPQDVDNLLKNQLPIQKLSTSK
ncbi:1185_t:CDS:2, partial [Racocetra persica]